MYAFVRPAPDEEPPPRPGAPCTRCANPRAASSLVAQGVDRVLAAGSRCLSADHEQHDTQHLSVGEQVGSHPELDARRRPPTSGPRQGGRSARPERRPDLPRSIGVDRTIVSASASQHGSVATLADGRLCTAWAQSGRRRGLQRLAPVLAPERSISRNRVSAGGARLGDERLVDCSQ